MTRDDPRPVTARNASSVRTRLLLPVGAKNTLWVAASDDSGDPTAVCLGRRVSDRLKAAPRSESRRVG